MIYKINLKTDFPNKMQLKFKVLRLDLFKTDLGYILMYVWICALCCVCMETKAGKFYPDNPLRSEISSTVSMETSCWSLHHVHGWLRTGACGGSKPCSSLTHSPSALTHSPSHGLISPTAPNQTNNRRFASNGAIFFPAQVNHGRATI